MWGGDKKWIDSIYEQSSTDRSNAGVLQADREDLENHLRRKMSCGRTTQEVQDARDIFQNLKDRKRAILWKI